MRHEQQTAGDANPGRWVPVFDAVEAVMERIRRDAERGCGQRPDPAAKAAAA